MVFICPFAHGSIVQFYPRVAKHLQAEERKGGPDTCLAMNDNGFILAHTIMIEQCLHLILCLEIVYPLPLF